MATTTWFNKTRTTLSVEGYEPVPKGKTWEQGVCRNCNSKSGVLFMSRTDNSKSVVACMRCHAIGVVK